MMITKNKITLLLLFFVNYSWFYKMGAHFHVLMGDDLASWDFFNKDISFFSQTISNTGSEKYRPIWNVIQYLLIKVNSNNYHVYFLINIFFNYIIVISLFRLVKKISNNASISFFICLIYITSRFAYYDILQLNGLMEASCIFLLIWILNYSLVFLKEGSLFSGYMIIILFFMIIFTHERFIALLPFICVMFFYNKLLTSKIKYLFISFPVIIVLINFIIKNIIFHIHLLVGTAGTYITFNPKTIFIFFGCGVLNLLGVNLGPSYLNGMLFQNSDVYVQIFSILISIMMLVIIFLCIKKNNFRDKEILVISLITLLILALLLIPVILTIRLELRWLYSPFVVLLFYLSYILGRLRKSTMYVFLILLTFLSLINNMYYKNNNSHVYFVRAQQVSERVYEETIKKYGSKISDYQIYIIKNSEFDWPLLGATFFRQFNLNKDISVEYINNPNDIIKPSDHLIILNYNDQTKQVESIHNLNN